jgi:NitT/TauT family transport system permease protein
MSIAEPQVDTVTSAPGQMFDAEEARHARRQRIEAIAKWALPVVVMSLTIWGWHRMVIVNEIPHYILPGPGLVVQTLIEDWGTLYSSLLVTLQISMMALLVAVLGGVGLAILFAQSKFAEMSFYPYAVILQVTPIISIAPLIFIYVESKFVALLICAWVVAFFPILANTTLGLRSADHNLRDLMTIYRANRWQKLIHLQIPSALPYFLGGLRIAGGLALIGAVVAEYVAGTGGMGSGLAFRILEASYRLNIPRMFAALLVSHLALRKWHESALKSER